MASYPPYAKKPNDSALHWTIIIPTAMLMPAFIFSKEQEEVKFVKLEMLHGCGI
jgi:hypothetical protein